MTTRTKKASQLLDPATAGAHVEGGDHLKAVALRTYCGHKHRTIGDDEILRLLPMVRKIVQVKES